jgi:ATP-dependent DNA helicase RecG
LEVPKIEEKNDFFDVEIMRSIAIEKQPELQPELKSWIDSGLEEEQQELEQELEQESLFSKILSKMLDKPKSRKEISRQLNQKSISGQLNEVLGKLYDRNLLEWTIPEKPNSSKQKFKLTKKGLAFYLLTRKKGGDL